MANATAHLLPPQSGQPCSCGGGRTFDACCGPRLDGTQPATTAEELMRSRFTAHVVRDYRYLHHTHRPTAAKPYVESPEDHVESMNWSRLVVHAHETTPNPDLSFVEFSAYFVDDRGEHAVHERSEFLRVGGKWLYTRAVRSGPAPKRSTAPKAGRNDPCPCGSGKKYKHCCLV